MAMMMAHVLCSSTLSSRNTGCPPCAWRHPRWVGAPKKQHTRAPLIRWAGAPNNKQHIHAAGPLGGALRRAKRAPAPTHAAATLACASMRG